MLCVASITNPNKISNTLNSIKGRTKSSILCKTYLDYLCDAFLFDPAKRYDVKENKYFDTPSKYYIVDVGFSNVRLNFRQIEENNIIANVLYNELKTRGYSVDVGVVETRETIEGTREKKQLEIDFIAYKENIKYYTQSSTL